MSAPEISHLQWGQMTIKENDRLTTYKDCRICPTGSENWNWKLTGTRHIPGIQFADLSDLLKKYPETKIIILSQGMEDQLETHPETLATLKTQYPQINVKVLNTRKAVNYYNQYRKTHPIIGLFHSTC